MEYSENYLLTKLKNTGQKQVLNEFNAFFKNAVLKLAGNIPNLLRPCENFIRKNGNTMLPIPFSINELKEALFSLKLNKCPGYNEKNFNAIKRCFRVLHVLLQYSFDISRTSDIYPDLLKIVPGTLNFKPGDPQNISNYRSISALTCFSKILDE